MEGGRREEGKKSMKARGKRRGMNKENERKSERKLIKMRVEEGSDSRS